MNNFFVIAISLIFSTNIYSQKASLSDLEELIGKPNPEEVHNELITKGWIYHKKDTIKTLRSQVWFIPNKNGYTPSLELFTYKNIPQKMQYVLYDNTKYKLILNQIKGANYQFIESIGNEEIKLDYYGNDKFIISATEFNENNNYSAYITLILKNSIYDDYDNKKVYFSDDYSKLVAIINYESDKVHEEYVLFNDNGNIDIIGNKKNGIKHGQFKSFYNDGSLKSKWTMVNGKYHGEDIFYEENRHSTQNYVNGILSGDYNIYMFNSKKDTIEHLNANYTNNKFHGITKHYKIKNNKKTLINKRHYVDGLLDGTFARVKNDTIIFGEYKNDTVNGTIRFYKDYNKLNTEYTRGLDTTGIDVKLITKGNYKSGVKNGTWKYYSVDGEVIKKGEYINNKQVGTWQYTYKDKGIIKDIQYTDNKAGLETYKTINTEKLYSGKLNFKDKNGVIEQVRIKDGYRNGLTIHKDTSGKEIKKIKYKNGVIKN